MSMQDHKHEHDRLLNSKNGKLVFGCINPFCEHGDLDLPNRWEILMETSSVTVSVRHDPKNRIAHFDVYLKTNVGKHYKGKFAQFDCQDDLVSCRTAFHDFFAGKL